MQVSNMSWLLFFVQLSLISWALLAAPQPASIAIFSIVARDPETGDFGIAVQSMYFDVGSVVPHARANAGVIATQAKPFIFQAGMPRSTQRTFASKMLEQLFFQCATRLNE